MTEQSKPLSRGEILARLRKQYPEAVERTQILLKEQKHIQQEICRVLRERPKTVPEIAAETNLSPDKVLWYMASFRKYGLVIENGMCGDYPLYQKAEEN